MVLRAGKKKSDNAKKQKEVMIVRADVTAASNRRIFYEHFINIHWSRRSVMWNHVRDRYCGYKSFIKDI
jgi:hypothetical protein